MQEIETIVFDLGGVLIDWDPRYVFSQVFPDKEEVDYFLTHVCSSDWNVQQDGGRPFAEAIKIKQEAYPKYHKEIPLFFSRWTEMIGGQLDGTVEILKALFTKRQHRLYALTNWSAETFPYAWENFDFLRLFEGILVSGREKLIKPDPAIYELLYKRYDIDPANALFIDDSLKNVQGSEATGMRAIHFSDPENLRNSLSSVGITF